MPTSLPTFFFAHGLAMETEMMVDGPRSFLNMARVGMRIVLPDGPGHNRRCKPGLYGGESFLTEPPISGIQHFVRAAREYAAMIAWCRAQGPGKISLGGVSLGALTRAGRGQPLALLAGGVQARRLVPDDHDRARQRAAAGILAGPDGGPRQRGAPPRLARGAFRRRWSRSPTPPRSRRSTRPTSC